MRAGTCGKESSVLNKLHACRVYLTVALCSIVHGASGFGEGRRIEYDQIKLSAVMKELRKQLEDIRGVIRKALIAAGIKTAEA